MPTGPIHERWVPIGEGTDDSYAEDGRCTLGENHFAGDDPWVKRSALTTRQTSGCRAGQDEDYTFGYSDEELKRASRQQ